MITNEQRIFSIEQTQRKLVESVKNSAKKESQPEPEPEPESETKTTEEQLKKEESVLEPIYPIKANYVLPELVNPIDYIKNLNL
jgi:hypothetical protein